MPTVTLVSESPPGWAPGTQHWRTDDGRNLAVEASPDAIPAGFATEVIDELLTAVGESFGSTKIVLPQTVIMECDPDGTPLDDFVPEPLWTFPPGTTHEQALEQAGYVVRTGETT
jgi:hypothetical protein